MLTKPIPLWVLVGGFLLAAMGGAINAVGLLCVHSHALSHLSGTVTSLGIDLAGRDIALARQAALVFISFFFGSALSGMIIRQSALQVGRRYGVALMAESVLLVAGALLLRHESVTGLYVAAMACGLQNGMATSYSGAVVRTTHVTGIVTDLGLTVGLVARGLKADWRRMRLYLVLLTGFFIGGILGAIGFRDLGSDTLLIPAALAGLTGFGYTVRKHFLRISKATIPRPSSPTA